ncbi:protein FAR1-RELATED SEQUENCE 5-like isoform X1 [Triticum dicoccoides]|uniref:protein FAR1-RELATED SEQUENCE 5-like isoform X1 n=1 Tax=Triticum dicoccoides TaxID=85692 RepID=UPI000E7ADA72|nr:protein FAR1-RELATED SEQUENCE 5-like isoform X1 [Triticum dicoccoides]
MESEAEANTVIPLQSHDVQSDAESTTRVNPPLDIGFFTPTKSTSIPTCDSFYTPDCDESITPTIGMYFSDVNTAKEFYEVYAHHVGFSVRVGQHKSSNGVMTHKRFMYAKESFREEKTGNIISEHGTKRRRERKITRCGCGAKIAIKHTTDGRYIVTVFEQVHNHVLVSPSKQQFIRSNRKVSCKAQSTLFNCHSACIGTSAAYRLLCVGLGGFQHAGCTKKDLQNFHRTLRCHIKSSDAQMFIDQLGRKNLANPGFYFDYVIDDKGRLVHVFWADATSRNNYKHFGNLVSFDSTYSTNEYNMIFAPFTGVNHHKGSILFGAAFLHDEKVASFVWLFQTFLKAMEGVEPTLMITDECASMISALHTVFPTTTHRLCMWHIMKKVGEKVSPDLKSNEYFHDHLNLVVWASETPSEFEERWSHVIEEFGLEENEWFTKRFELRESWIPAYFNDIALSGLLRTTSRSESANAFFSRIIGYKHAFVEFWLRFETALEEQRHKELEDDNVSLHTSPPLKTSWGLEKHGSIVFTHEVFTEFQKELLADREHNTR